MPASDVSSHIQTGTILVGGQTWNDLQAAGQGNKLQQAMLLVNTGIANQTQQQLL